MTEKQSPCFHDSVSSNFERMDYNMFTRGSVECSSVSMMMAKPMRRFGRSCLHCRTSLDADDSITCSELGRLS